MEQEAECLRSKADSFCLQGLLDREVNGFKSQKHNDLLIKAKESVRNRNRRERDAKVYEKFAISYEADAKESENHLNEFRRKKAELQTEKDKLERSLPKWEEKLAKKKGNLVRKREKMTAEIDYALWRVFQ